MPRFSCVITARQALSKSGMASRARAGCGSRAPRGVADDLGNGPRRAEGDPSRVRARLGDSETLPASDEGRDENGRTTPEPPDVKITGKILLAFLFLSLAPLAGTAILVSANSERALAEQVLNQLDAVASVQESRLDAIVGQNLERLALVSSRTQLRISLENYTRDPRPEYRDTMIKILTDARASVSSFRDLHVLALNGTIVASTNGTAIGANHSADPFFLRGQAGNLADIFFLDPGRGLGVYLSGPLRLNNSLIGVVAIESGVENILSMVNEYSGLGLTGETQIAERAEDGGARFLTPTRFDPSAALNRTVPSTEQGSPILVALAGNEVLVEDAKDYRGIVVLAASRYLERTGWGLVVKIDRAEAFAPAVSLRDLMLAITLLSSVAVGLVSFYVARSITGPIRNLTETATQISGGDLDRRAPVATRDEIGTLAQAFNQMAKDLVETNLDLERRVQERTEQLARSNAELEQFAYIASHDLQEPLRMVSSFTRLLADRYQGKLDSDADEFISYAADGAVRMQTLINDLLTYSRVGTRGKEFEPTDVEAVVDRVLDNLQSTTEESGAVITRDSMPTVVADGSQLLQVFQNLISNATKFRGEAVPRIHIGARREEGAWIFSVRDNGIGIDPKDFDRLFVMFQRLHGRTEYPGTGIGLAVCKKIVERHRGRIWVESNPGKGATFFFTIPAKEALKG